MKTGMGAEFFVKAMDSFFEWMAKEHAISMNSNK
jgi:hypothetical protein